MRRPSWLVCIATDTVTSQWCDTVHLRHAGREQPKGDDPRTDHGRGFTRISRAGIPKRPLPNCQAGPTALSTPLFRVFRHAQKPWGGHPWWTGPLTTSLRGLWVSGYLLRAMADRAQGRRPENRPGGNDSDPGLAPRRERDPTANIRVTLEPAWTAPTYSEGKGPEDPGVVAPLADAGCRGNRRYDMFGRSHMSAFF